MGALQLGERAALWVQHQRAGEERGGAVRSPVGPWGEVLQHSHEVGGHGGGFGGSGWAGILSLMEAESVTLLEMKWSQCEVVHRYR